MCALLHVFGPKISFSFDKEIGTDFEFFLGNVETSLPTQWYTTYPGSSTQLTPATPCPV